MPQRGEIVVYRSDGSIVLYSRAGQVRAMAVNGDEVTSFSDDCGGNVCPFCGSVLPADKYDFVAKAYFNLLQSSFQGAAAPGGAGGMSSLPDEANDEATGGPSGPSEAPPGATVPKNIPSHLLVTGYYARFFVEGRRLGSGSFGHVFSCVHILDDLMLGEFAVKKLPVGDDMGWLRAAIKEIKIRENIRHRNVVDYNHSWLEMYALNAMAPVVPYLFMLMEYCNGGNLEDFCKWAYCVSGAQPTGPKRLQDEVPYGDDASAGGGALGDPDGLMGANAPEGPLGDAEVMALLCDIVAGLDHLHRNFIVHRDLKPSNILLKFAHRGATALISDFGTCEIFSQRSASGFTGTIEFTAPELLGGSSGASGAAATHKSDMWSLGVILHYMAYGRLPFAAFGIAECMDLIRYADIVLPSNCAHSQSPDARPDCGDIMGDPEVALYSGDSAENERTRRSLYNRFMRYRDDVA